MLVLLFRTCIEQTVRLAARANRFERSPAQQTLTRPNSTSDSTTFEKKKQGYEFACDNTYIYSEPLGVL